MQNSTFVDHLLFYQKKNPCGQKVTDELAADVPQLIGND